MKAKTTHTHARGVHACRHVNSSMSTNNSKQYISEASRKRLHAILSFLGPFLFFLHSPSMGSCGIFFFMHCDKMFCFPIESEDNFIDRKSCMLILPHLILPLIHFHSSLSHKPRSVRFDIENRDANYSQPHKVYRK